MDGATIFSMVKGVGDAFGSAYADGRKQALDEESGAIFDKMLGGGGAPTAAASSGFVDGVGAAYKAARPEPGLPTFVNLSGANPSSERKLAGTNADFVNAMLPHALEASKATGVDPRIIVAQSAIETGWGRSAPGNNYFGVKSHGQPGGNQLATTEVVDGKPVRVTDSFRAFPSMEASALGYADFINANSRYASLKSAQGLDAQAAALQRSGYATDPQYGAKVLSVARSLPETTQAVAVAPAAAASPAAVAPASGLGVAGGLTPEVRQSLSAAWKNPHTRSLAASVFSSLISGKGDWEMKDVNGQSSWVNTKQRLSLPVGERKVDPTTEERNFKAAQAGGFEGSFMDFLDTQRRSAVEKDEGAKITQAIEARRAQAGSLGLAEGTPAWQSFVATGKMGRDQDLSATDKKAILEAEESVLSAQTAIDSLSQAKTVSPKAYVGPTAGVRGYGMSLIGDEAGEATQELGNIVTTNALGQMKAIFGGNPTEGERKILLDIQGSVGQPDAVRQKIFDRGIALAQKRLDFNQKRAESLKGGTFYKSDAPAPSEARAPEKVNPSNGAPQGARQASDGKWYVADPARPGKYLQVQ